MLWKHSSKSERLRCISYMFAFSVIGKSLKIQLLKRAKTAEKAENVLLWHFTSYLVAWGCNHSEIAKCRMIVKERMFC